MFNYRKNSLGKIIQHGKILNHPCRQPKSTTNSVGYELGKCFQLDQKRCMLVASMDEQGGGDLCVGNDAFIFERLSGIKAENAIPLNWSDPEYELKSGSGSAFLAKYPVTGTFMPKGALKEGQEQFGAGTGLLVSSGITFNADRSNIDEKSEVVFEFMQIKWDGKTISVTRREMLDTLLGYTLLGTPLSYFLIDEGAFLAPFLTNKGMVVFRFEFDSEKWTPVSCGRPFMTFRTEVPGVNCLPGESEPSILKRDDHYLIFTRGNDTNGRVYISEDGLNFELLFARPNNMIPQVLNKGLDSNIYLATNPSMDMLRNPLLAYPMINDSFGEPVMIHDEGGIRGCEGKSIPFVDHAVGVNLYIEGRWRHFIWYRVCDLRERPWGGHSPDLKKRNMIGGLYVAEIEYNQLVNVPFVWQGRLN